MNFLKKKKKFIIKKDNGAAVIGCYNPTSSVTEVHEHTMKTGDKGNNKPYRNC